MLDRKTVEMMNHLATPLRAFLLKYGDPHSEIRVSQDRVTFLQELAGSGALDDCGAPKRDEAPITHVLDSPYGCMSIMRDEATAPYYVFNGHPVDGRRLRSVKEDHQVPEHWIAPV